MPLNIHSGIETCPANHLKASGPFKANCGNRIRQQEETRLTLAIRALDLLNNGMFRLFSVLIIAAGVAAGTSAVRAELRAGTALVDITPEKWPLPMRGAFHPGLADSAADPLHVRALVLDDGTTAIALALVDSCMVHRDVLDSAKELAVRATGIPAANMMVSATHTHSAPFANARHGTPEELAYQEQLRNGIADAIREAAANRQTAKIGWSSHDLPDEVFNRRWYLKPGKMPENPFGSTGDQVKMNPPRGNDVLDRPAGPTDPEVSVLYVEDKANRPLAVLANFALHYVGNTDGKMSADYFGEFSRLMPVRLGRTAEGFVAMLTNGTSGDINNINFRNPRPRREPFEQIRIVASKTADAATQAVRNVQEMRSEVRLAMAQREVTLKHRVPTDRAIERARQLVAGPLEEDRLPGLARIYAERTLELAGKPPTTKVLVQAIRVGDLAICTLPFEALVEIGLELKERSPASDTFVVELVNGAYGYLPTPRQHKLGGYETWLGTNKVQEDASEILTKHLLEMLGDLFQ